MSTQTNTTASDYVRVHFHALTEWELTAGRCRTCWNDVVFLLSGAATPADTLAAPHACAADWNSAQILALELTEHPEKW